MKCKYCRRRAVDSLPGNVICLCGPCSLAFMEGFDKGRIFESIRTGQGHDRRREAKEE